jgi:hypothetical protein
MVSKVRRSIAVFVALMVTVVTLGRVPLNWTGNLGAGGDGNNHERPAAASLEK